MPPKRRSVLPKFGRTLLFTSNDVIVNIGVIAAGVLVLVLGSKIPDLVIGAVVFTVVLRGSIGIIKLSK